MQKTVNKITLIVLVGFLLLVASRLLVVYGCGGKPNCTHTPPPPPVVVTPPTPEPEKPSKNGSSGSMLTPCHYFPGEGDICTTTPSQWYQWNNPIIREQIMEGWRCRTFGGDYCPKVVPQPITQPTPAQIYGK